MDFLIVCTHLQDKTGKYYDLYKLQHILDVLIVCKDLQHSTDKYHELYRPQHAWYVYLFYRIGVYIPSGNPEHVLIYTNHGICLF
jgi:hypothetical protein